MVLDGDIQYACKPQFDYQAFVYISRSSPFGKKELHKGYRAGKAWPSGLRPELKNTG